MSNLIRFPISPYGSGGYPARGVELDLPPRGSGGYPTRARGRSRSPGRGGSRVHGVRVVEHIEVELAPDLEELRRQGRELREQWRDAGEQVLWCEHDMVPLDHHERAERELQLMDEQAAEEVYCQYHEHFTRLVRDIDQLFKL